MASTHSSDTSIRGATSTKGRERQFRTTSQVWLSMTMPRASSRTGAGPSSMGSPSLAMASATWVDAVLCGRERSAR